MKILKRNSDVVKFTGIRLSKEALSARWLELAEEKLVLLLFDILFRAPEAIPRLAIKCFMSVGNAE